jgi:hypothetical protein
MMPKKITLERVLEVESHGLSIGKSAYLLDVAVTTLARYIRDNRIVWRGKKRFGFNPYSNNQLILSSGVPSSTVYERMARGLTLHEALNHTKWEKINE